MIARQIPRNPVSCPPGFKGHYTVLPGDTFYTLSQIFRVRLEALAVVNPHITDPNILYPGDTLCVPGLINFPCAITLRPMGRVPFGTGGSTYVNFGPQGGQAVTTTATLPLPTALGPYDSYITEILIPDIGGFANQLFRTSESPPTWTVRIELPTAASLTPDTQVVVRPYNSTTGVSGPIVLAGSLGDCETCLGSCP
jgi:hypothetical protein